MTIQNVQTKSVAPENFVEGLSSAIRENPVAAGLVGLGVLWMFFGSAKIGSAATAISGAAEDVLTSASHGVVDTVWSASEAAASRGAEAVDKGSETARQVKEAAQEHAEAVRGKISTLGHDAKNAANQFGLEAGRAVQQNLTHTMEQQPLMLGVIGLGIGAGVASMFAATDVERNLMGEAGPTVKEKIRVIASQTAESAEKVFEEVKNEARA